MKPTDTTLREQLRLTEREIERRKTLLNLTNKDRDILLKLKPIIAESIDNLVESFYEKQVQVDEIARVIGDSDTLTRLKSHMRKYILDLFDGNFDVDYVQSRLRIGLVHKRIGVTPKLYISGIWNLLQLLSEENISERKKGCATCKSQIDSITKAILFDFEFVFDTYIHSLMDELKQGKEDLRRYSESLEETVAKRTQDLAELALKDGLTKLFNQRSFFDSLRRELSRSHRRPNNLSLIYFDLDGFKKINDNFGHQRGDEILTATSNIMESIIRAEDIAARYGGDEFCIILPHTSSSEAEIVANRLIEKAKEEEKLEDISFSIGIATKNSEMIIDIESLVKRADSAMYQSKEQPGYTITIADAE